MPEFDAQSANRIADAVRRVERLLRTDTGRNISRRGPRGGGASFRFGRIGADIDPYNNVIEVHPFIGVTADLFGSTNIWDPANAATYFDATNAYYAWAFVGRLVATGVPVLTFRAANMAIELALPIPPQTSATPPAGSTPTSDPAAWADWYPCEPDAANLAVEADSNCTLPGENDLTGNL